MLNKLKIKIFADGASLKEIKDLNNLNLVEGFTTNPSLMRQSGVLDYEIFAKTALQIVGNKPISFEIFADDEESIIEQALVLNSWGENIFIKIPITNTQGRVMSSAIQYLSSVGVKLNITAIFNNTQIEKIMPFLCPKSEVVLSIFAGRIADTGLDPKRIVRDAVIQVSSCSNFKVLWASTRELFNIIEADQVGCHIITVPYNFFPKLSLFGKNLDEFSLETVKMFHRDAIDSNYSIKQEIMQ
jgi:transaldolase